MVTTHTGAVVRSRSIGGAAVRLVLTALGTAGLVLAAFLHWTRDIAGIDLNWHAVYQDSFTTTTKTVLSLGGASIALGLVALLGLADRSAWLTRLAGAVGLVGFVLFIVQVQRSADHSLQMGTWIGLAGAAVCVVAGFAGGTTTVVETDE